MPAQPTGKDFRVRGENAPAWLVLGITLAGLIGSMITAGLLLPNSSKAHRDVASEQTVDEATSDCAPLFPIKFEHGSVKPQVADMKQKIEALAAWLRAQPAATLYLDGYADASGPEEYNLVLSFRRADAVAELLEGAGAPKAQLVVRVYGEDQSSSRSTETAFERRVDLTIDAGTPCDEPSPTGGDLR